MSHPSPSLARGSLAMLISMSTAGAISLLISITIARMIGAEDFGVYFILVSVQGVAAIFAVFGIGTAIAKFVAEYRVRDMSMAYRFAKSGLLLIAVLGTVTSVVYVTLSDIIGNGLYHEPLVAALIPFSALVVLTSSLLAAMTGIVQGCQNIRLLATIQVTVPIVNIGLIVLFLSLIGLKGIFIGYTLSQSTIALAVFLIINKSDFKFYGAPLETRGSVVIPKILGFSFPAFLGAVIVIPIYWVGNTLLTLDEGFEATGFFAVTYVIFQSLILIPNSIVIPMIPKVSELIAQNRENVDKLVSKTVRVLSIVLFPLVFGLALFANFVVELLYGPEFSSSAEAAFMMVCASYFYALSALVGAMIAGAGRMWLGLAINICWGIAFLIVALLFIPALGVSGLSLAFVLSYGVLLVVSFFVSKHSLSVNLRSSYFSSASSAAFFVIGFLVCKEVGTSAIATKIALFGVSLVYIYLFGRDAISHVVRRAGGFLGLMPS